MSRQLILQIKRDRPKITFKSASFANQVQFEYIKKTHIQTLHIVQHIENLVYCYNYFSMSKL